MSVKVLVELPSQLVRYATQQLPLRDPIHPKNLPEINKIVDIE